jgi:hypothetical protein
MAVAVLMVLSFVGTADAQRKKGSQGKRIQTMDIVISEVGEATVGYQVERRGRMRTRYIGVADVTRVQKADYKDVALKDLKKGDKALVTLYKDPDDPYFPALSIKVYGKAVMMKKARRAKKKKK